MKKSRFLLVLIMILPWFSLPLLGRRTLYRFLPSSIFICIVVKITNMMAKKRKWWLFYSSIHPKVPGDIPFIIGPFFIGTLWLLKMTFGRFPLYILANSIVHFLFAFPGMKFIKSSGIASLIKMSPIQLVFTLELRAFLLYGIQFVLEKFKPFSSKKIFRRARNLFS